MTWRDRNLIIRRGKDLPFVNPTRSIFFLGCKQVDNPEDRERMLDVWLGLTGQAPLPPGPLVLPVLSGSMRPTIPLGSRIRIKPAQGAACRVGDVIVYLDGTRLVAHRVLWRAGSWIYEKGDANPFGNWLPKREIKGVVREVFPAEDVGGTFPGRDPFNQEAVRQSRHDLLRNLVLFVPRQIRGLLTDRNRPNEKE